ncbi:MAG: hypothetical protein AAFV88_13870 [Planctomycetota bacterium]
MSWRRIFSAVGLVAVVMVVVVAAQGPSVPLSTLQQDPAEGRGQVGVSGELIGFSGLNGSGSQTITLVHTGKMQIAVYHIDGSGQIHLVSSRPIDDDFSITLNATAPLPGQIRPLADRVK